MSHSSSNEDLSSGHKPKNVKVAKEGEPINVLVVGVDIGTPGAKNPNDPKRTDTMMVMHYNPDKSTVNVVSVPRDTMIRINGRREKINAAHAIGGMDYAIDAVEKLLDIPINYYVKVDYQGFREIIDALGGIEMPIKYNMNYDDPEQNLHIHFRKGTTVNLDGKKAEEFFRWRKNNNGTGLAEGDIGRIKNQHMFIEKVMEKVKSPTIVLKLNSILSIIPKYIKTNMQPGEIISYGLEIAKLDNNNIKMSTLQGEGKYINKVSYYVYDSSKNAELLNELHDLKPMSIDKGDIKIKVLNGTKKSGLASNFSTYLNQKGYTNIKTGNGQKTNSTKIIFNKKLDEDVMSNIKNEFNIHNVENNYSNDGNFDIIVLLGEDHDYIQSN
ncbi:LCP family protein [Haloimpatiens sp. FM7330]|uniref:LCP family protein n=1 Tax=Haloimpatiens sp. FM7330 TaxID=3298610 RepID=UPI00363AD936